MRTTVIALVATASHASAVCVDWSASGRFADIEASDVVFEGVVDRIEQDTSSDCAPDRVVFRAIRVWKGEKAREFTLLQATDRGHEVAVDGQRVVSSCPIWVEQDTFYSRHSYIVFASRSEGRLESMGCGLSSKPKGRTRKRLNAWLSGQVGNK